MTRRVAWPAALAGALLLAAAMAQAQKVYRCGSEGRVVYQQSPCNDGKPIDAADPRSAEQRKAAQDVARDEAKAAAKFDRANQPASAPKDRKTQPAAHGASKPAAAGKKASDADKPPPAYLTPAQNAKPAASAP